MRFSLNTLCLLVLLTALSINAYTKWRSAATKQSQAETLRRTLYQNQGTVPEADRFVAWQRSRQQIEAATERHSKLTQKLAVVFKQEVAKLKIVASPDQFSIRGIPTVIAPGDFEKQWAVFVPADRAIAVAVEFIDPTPLENDFENQATTTVDLAAGHHQIKASFICPVDPAGTDDPDLPGRRVFALELDGKTIAQHESTHDEHTGGSRMVPDFREQGNYGPDQPVPDRLLEMTPRPGDCSVVVKLIEVDHETQQ